MKRACSCLLHGTLPVAPAPGTNRTVVNEGKWKEHWKEHWKGDETRIVLVCAVEVATYVFTQGLLKMTVQPSKKSRCRIGIGV